MSLSISIPFFLTYLGYDPLDVSLVLLVAVGVSTFYIYFYTLLKIDIKKKLILMDLTSLVIAKRSGIKIYVIKGDDIKEYDRICTSGKTNGTLIG